MAFGRQLTRCLSSASTATATADKSRFIPSDGIYPQGFVAGSVAAGIKKKAGALDMVLVRSDRPCTAAGVFTLNAFAAAPVAVSKSVIGSRGSGVTGVVVNSGCANACTGDQGMSNAWATANAVDDTFGISRGSSNVPSTIVMSTGVIGQQLPMDRIMNGIQSLGAKGALQSSHEGWMLAAKGIMTTDTFPKVRSQQFTAGYRMAGWSKGAGMIHPNMATMLSAVFTDAAVSEQCLKVALKHAADRSFNSISVDGDTSTNDSFIVLANGASEVVIDNLESKDFAQFTQDLTEFSTELAKLIVRDGEGATKFVEVKVSNAESFDQAKLVATTICKSPLVKTALYGKDANWGRIVCAVGYSGAAVNPSTVSLTFRSSKSAELPVFHNGTPIPFDEDVALEMLQDDHIFVNLDLGLGEASATMYTCDFSHEYISINADYRS